MLTEIAQTPGGIAAQLNFLLTIIGLALTLMLFLVGALMRQGAKNVERLDAGQKETIALVATCQVDIGRIDERVEGLERTTEALASDVRRVQNDQVRALHEQLRQQRREAEE